MNRRRATRRATRSIGARAGPRAHACRGPCATILTRRSVGDRARRLLTQWTTIPQPVGESRWRLPHPSELPEGDIVAIGGDLAPSSLVNAYCRGIFPMEVSGLPDVLGWWSPDPRGILPLDKLRVTRSMRQ